VSEPAGEARAPVTVLTRLLPLACLAAALCLIASEAMTMFEFTPPGAEALSDQAGGDRHGNSLALIGAFAIGALALAVFAASKPAATAVAVAGVIALLVFLLLDLPDANAVGTLDDARGSFFDAEAVPQEGFFFTLVSALALAVTGIGLATLAPDQLAALGPARLRGNGAAKAEAEAEADEPEPAGEDEREEKPASEREQAADEDERSSRRLERRRRPRQRR
jgi:hypothetical protein